MFTIHIRGRVNGAPWSVADPLELPAVPSPGDYLVLPGLVDPVEVIRVVWDPSGPSLRLVAEVEVL